ncbi:MAG: glycosyltransferase family 4 protein [Lachnospiraceae bacterium]|nr:glycosyltransferase family 4 protein [Lachnospiraceae bacterium]
MKVPEQKIQKLKIRELKILYIASGDFKYGAPKSLCDLMLALRKNHAITPVLLTKKKNSLNELCDREGIENYSFWYRDIMAGAPYRNPFMRLFKHVVKYGLFLFGALTYRGINRIGIDFSQINIIHTNLNRLDIGVYLSKKYTIPHVWHIREFGEDDYNVVMYKRGCIKYMMENANKFIAISNAVKTAWIKKGINEEKITRIYNGIDPANFKPKKLRNDSILKIVIVGHIQPNKGQLQIIEAIGRLSSEIRLNICLDLLGESYLDYKKLLIKRIKELNLEKQVHLIGYQKNIPDILSNYDIGVTCSKSEGFGRISIEYMLAGLAVIASDTGANTEIITDGIDGRIYRYGDPAHLAEIINELFNNPGRLESLAYAGRKKAESHFSIDNCAGEVYNLYQEMIKN